jgi:hypothetical protein
MNKIKFLPIVVVLAGCYPAHEHTYPTLDGTYILRSVTVNTVDIYGSEISDETHDDPMTVVYPTPIGPLDTMKVGKTRISFSGNKMFTGYYLQNGGDHWKYEYDIMLTQDFITGEWVNISVNYDTDSLITTRKYLVIEDGIEYLTIECPKQYNNGPFDNEHSYSLTFYREGP